MVRCHCGRPLHYYNDFVYEIVSRLVETQGESVPVTVDGRTWLVQRHYLALHGLRAWELPTLGFPEV